MEDFNKALLLDLNFRTALLESLNWDESQFDSFLLYLQEAIAKLSSPDDILEYIKREYGDASYDLIKKMFLEAYIENGLYNSTKDDHEH